MGSRTTYILLPRHMEQLHCKGFLEALDRAGFRLDPSVVDYALDSQGEIGGLDEISLRAPFAGSLCRLVRPFHEIEVEFVSRGVVLSGGLGSPHATPLFSLTIGTRRLKEFDPAGRLRFEATVSSAAEAAGAVGVLVVADPADDFKSSLTSGSGGWHVDLRSDGPSHSYWPVEYWYRAGSSQIQGLINPQELGAMHGPFRVVVDA